jgi:hypothetical protein
MKAVKNSTLPLRESKNACITGSRRIVEKNVESRGGTFPAFCWMSTTAWADLANEPLSLLESIVYG